MAAPPRSARVSRRSGAPLAASALAALALTTASPRAEAPGVIAPEPRAWSIVGDLDPDEATNLSGLACAVADGPARACLLVSDAKRYARLVTVGEGTISLGAEVPLLPAREGGQRYEDTDGEGVDFEGGRYYVAGSHGASRRRGEYERSRFWVYRFPVDAAGRPTFLAPDDDPPDAVERTNRLEAVLAGLPELADHACTASRPCRSLQADGVNVEGMAVRDGHLFLGLRGPSLGGAAHVVRVGLDALFGAAEVRPEVLRLRLGEGVGIRDLAKVRDGFLVLTGPARPEAEDAMGTAALHFWSGRGEETAVLGALGGAASGVKPEALLVLGEDEAGYQVLVLSDGPVGGRPTEYRVPRRR